MTDVYLGLGSTLQPEENLSLAVRELAKRFREEIGDLHCKAIVGYDFSDPEGYKNFRQSDVPTTKCRPMVGFVVKQVLAAAEEGGVLPTK